MRTHLGGVDTRTAASQERPSSVIVVGGGMTSIAAADPELLAATGPYAALSDGIRHQAAHAQATSWHARTR